MKRAYTILLAVLVAALLCGAARAEADYTYYGTMTVVNCEEWVSLRDVPRKDGNRLAKVPLGATVTEAEWIPSQGQFIYCCYEGQYGYILSEFLEASEDDGGSGEWVTVMDAQVGDVHVLAERGYYGPGEYLLVSGEDVRTGLSWYHEAITDYLTELTLTDARIGGTADDPLVLVYKSQDGLTALEPDTGKTRWKLTDEFLGASVTWAVDSDGTLYMGGYYGPDPVAIDRYGNIVWRSDSQGCCWLYDMSIEGDTLVCRYDMMDESTGGAGGTVVYSLDGRLLEKRAEG